MPINRNANAAGQLQVGKAQAAIEEGALLPVAGTVFSQQLRMVGEPNLSLVVDNRQAGAVAITVNVEVRIQTAWRRLPDLVVAGGAVGYANYPYIGAREARFALTAVAPGTAPGIILSATG